MNLQTKVDIPQPSFTLSYRDKGLFVGSCFASSLHSYLSYRKADAVLCPYGEMYNPVSIASFFLKSSFSFEDVIQAADGLWYSWYHHGSVYATTRDAVLERINADVCSFSDAGYVVITLGTSWVYELNDGRIVSNCHKMSSAMFSRRSLSLDEILAALRTVISKLSGVKFIITVSPIRHIKDGLVENSYSKSLLRVAAGVLQSENPNVYYFPSYEIMNDELRDYRFYSEDMLHPTDQASSYIMEKFVSVSFDSQSRTFFDDIVKLRHAFGHRPLHPESVSYIKFRRYQKELLEVISKRYPESDFNDFSLFENI